MFAGPYARYYDSLNEEKPYQKEIEFVYKWAENPKSIFDIGCGTASYWKYYPENVCVIGIDKSKAMAQNKPHIIHADITKFRCGNGIRVDCATALFNVMNYIPEQDWWGNIPVNVGGYFIFDIWDKKKVEKEGFSKTERRGGGVIRQINPVQYDGETVELEIEMNVKKRVYKERHRMRVYGPEEIIHFADRNKFEIVSAKNTDTWQQWYKLRKK